jgi:O-6-methylguanine DNA methyltransferase
MKQRHSQAPAPRGAARDRRSDAWLRETFNPPTLPHNLVRSIMRQLDLDLSTQAPLDLLDRLALAASPGGITQVSLRRGRAPAAPPAAGGRIGALLDLARRELEEYLAGQRTFFTVPVDLSRVPAFERSALEVAARIPYGEVRSYRWIAEQLGQPEAARAVGNAMAGNPIPIIVPCHRVVRSDGTLGGYSFGLVRKETFLALERGTSPYVGCATTRILCRRGCAHEQRIRPGGRIHFLALADALSSGYRPCQSCRPA